MIEIIYDLMGIGCATALLVAFILIKVFGGYMAVEYIQLILYLEIALCLTIIIVGINRLRGDLKNR